MKNLVKKVLLIAVMVTGLVGMAKDGAMNIEVRELNAKLVQFTLNNNDGDLSVTVKDENGYVLYNEAFQGSIYTKTYDLSTLPSGLYFVELDGETKIKTIPFRVKKHRVEFKYNNAKTYYKPVVTFKDKTVNITKLALDLEPLTIEVYNEYEELIHEETLSGKMDLKRSLNFKELAEGSYEVILRSKGEVITKTINI